MNRELVERFANLFVGGQLGYGLWDRQKGARTVHEPPSISNYEAHLNGEIGLGLVPVQENGTCRFAAIDIDVDTIDHAQLFESVSKRHLPLAVCRSKSGGAHLYAFMDQGFPAPVVRDVLRKWATLLGHPRAEIFPKQDLIGRDNVGSWINLPYFAGNGGTRYAVGPNGSLSLEEFLDVVPGFDPNVKVEAGPINGFAVLEQMPPCLRKLTEGGVGEGHRNMTLTNVAIFYKKINPDTVQEAVAKYNQEHVDPPLANPEVRSAYDSIIRHNYASYMCNQEPLFSHCDKDACGKLTFGYKHRPWDTPDSSSNFTITELCKINTDDPYYKMKVNSRALTLGGDDFLTYPKFKTVLSKKLDIIPPMKKQAQWDHELRVLFRDMVIEEAPAEATPEGQLLHYLHEFLDRRQLATNREDILRGNPITEGQWILFQMEHFVNHLKNHRINKTGDAIWVILHKHGAFSKKISVNNKKINVCHFPLSGANDQLEYTAANFEKDREEM